MRLRPGLLAAVIALLGGLVPAVAGASTLSGGAVDGPVSVAVVPTGHLAEPGNRFFQTFTSTGGPWSLSTPRGTATNGGIVISSPADGVVAVLPYFASHVTALQGLVAGRPGRVGAIAPALAAEPGAMSINPATGATAAVGSPGELLLGARPLGRLAPRGSVRQLAATEGGRRCGFAGLAAAAVESDGTIVVGGRCTHRGWSGLLVERREGSWTPLRAPGPGSWRVIRIDPTTDGALVLAASIARRPVLRIGVLHEGIPRWGPPLRMSGQLRSTAVTMGSANHGSYLVALSAGGRIQPWRLAVGGPPRRVGPTLGPGVQAVVDGPTPAVTAFAVDGRAVAELELAAGGARWVPAGRQVLPLAYGTSR